MLDIELLFDDIQSTIEPVATASTVRPIFMEAPEILPAAQPTLSNEILQHDPENLSKNEIIVFTDQQPALALEQDILHDNESELFAEEVEILHEHEATTTATNSSVNEDITGFLKIKFAEEVVNLHELEATTTTNSSVNEDITGFLKIQCIQCSEMDEIADLFIFMLGSVLILSS